MKAQGWIQILMCIVTIVLMQQSSGQPKRATEESFLNLTNGMTLDEVASVLGTNSLHQFTAELEGKKLHCLSYAFEEPFVYYYFIFEGERLFKVCLPPKFRVKIWNESNRRIEVREPVDPIQRIQDTLAQQAMTGLQVYEDIKKSLGHRRAGEDAGILPAFVITSPLLQASLVVHGPAQRKEQLQNKELALRFSPSKVKLGMAVSLAIQEYGTPSKRHTSQNGLIICWKSSLPLKRVKLEHRYSPICVLEKEGVIAGIFSNDFVVSLDKVVGL